MAKGKRTVVVADPVVATPVVTPVVDEAAVAAAKAEAKAKAGAAREAAKAAEAEARKQALHAAHERLRELREAEATKRRCLCGCGASTPTAFFVPGHDAKLVSRWLSEAKAEAKAA